MTRNSRARIDSLIRTELLLIVTLLELLYEFASRALLIDYSTKIPPRIQEVLVLSVLQGFGNMRGVNIVTIFEVGNRACYAQYSKVCTGTKLHFIGGSSKKTL